MLLNGREVDTEACGLQQDLNEERASLASCVPEPSPASQLGAGRPPQPNLAGWRPTGPGVTPGSPDSSLPVSPLSFPVSVSWGKLKGSSAAQSMT